MTWMIVRAGRRPRVFVFASVAASRVLPVPTAENCCNEVGESEFEAFAFDRDWVALES